MEYKHSCFNNSLMRIPEFHSHAWSVDTCNDWGVLLRVCMKIIESNESIIVKNDLFASDGQKHM